MENEAKIFAKAFLLAIEGKDEISQKKIAQNFLKIAILKKKTHLFPKIIKELEKIEKEKEAVLILARDLGSEAEEKIKKSFEKDLGEGRKFKIKTDKAIIGGFKIKTSNFLIDSSIKTIIEDIRKKLI